MKITPQQGVWIGATLIVALIGAAMFVLAGQPMTGEAATAQAWIDALCTVRLNDLYQLSALPVDTDPADFTAQTVAYITGGEIPQPCIGQVNLNLIRSIPVPESLEGEVDSIRLYSEAVLRGTASGQETTIPLWLYHYSDGRWAVWANYFAVVPEHPVGIGEPAVLTDSNGLSIGMAQIKSVAAYEVPNQTIIAVTIDLTTLSLPWEWYAARLFIGQSRAQAVQYADQLPEEWRTGFLYPFGEYTPQNLLTSGTFWFRSEQPVSPMMIAFSVTAPYSGTLKATYLDIPVESVTEIEPFNPFRDSRLVHITDGNPVFEMTVDTTGLPAPQLMLECSRFALVLEGEPDDSADAPEEWRRPTECSFLEGQQRYVPDERMRLRVTFAGYQINDRDRIKLLMYRRIQDPLVIRYQVWEPG